MAQKIDVPTDVAQLTQPYAPPEGASIADLKELARTAQETAVALLDNENYSDDDYQKAMWLSGAIDVVNGVIAAAEEAEAERQRARDELRSKVAPTEPEGEGEGGDGTPAPTPADAAPADPAMVAAAAAPIHVPSVGDIARKVGQPKVPVGNRKGSASLVAAVDVPGFQGGAELDVTDVGRAFEARARGMAGLMGSNAPRVQHGFANIKIDVEPALVAGGSQDESSMEPAISYAVTEYLRALTPEARGKGLGALIAAGWCAPSEPLYDLLNLSTTDGLVTLPEISVTRGGLKYATGPDFGTVYNGGALTTLTETQAISSANKNKLNIPCPSPVESRMNADALFLTGDILSQRGWPEAYTDYIAKAMIVWEHYTSALTIADMVANSQAVNLSTFGTGSIAPEFGAIPTVLGALELQGEDMRYRNRLSRNIPLELVLPFFARGILRADMTKRLDTDGGSSVDVTDAMIDNWFAVRGFNPQYVYDWQDNIATGGSANPFGAQAASGYATTWPQTFKAVMYAPGTFVRARTPVIELSTLYDSTLLATNQYVGLFTEQGRLTIKRGFDSRVITLASNPSGVTGGYATPATPQTSTPI